MLNHHACSLDGVSLEGPFTAYVLFDLVG